MKAAGKERFRIVAPSQRQVTLDFTSIPGWQCFRQDADGVLWGKGYLHGETFEDIGKRLSSAKPQDIPTIIAALDGHFAVVWQDDRKTIAATDPIASIPLSYRSDVAGEITLTGAPRRLLKDGDETSPDQTLIMAMAGFTIGNESLYPAIQPIGCGRVLVIDADGEADLVRYHRYLPHPVSQDEVTLRARLRELTLGIMEKMVRSLDGRTIAVPLSAGLDSRLIVSALKEIGYDRVVCFSYGRRGNHEAEAARKIASTLGYDWHFIAHTPHQQALTFESADCRRFVDGFADTLQAIPFQQDFFAVGEMRRLDLVAEDAVFVNGQSGDFIAGNHIPSVLADPGPPRLFDAFEEKHLGMWACLKTPENLARVEKVFFGERDDYTASTAFDPDDFALYEALEYENRQCKYVVAGQRTYEWHGFDWRLPLWDRSFIDFWETVPLTAKLGERLYREMLNEANWGGVWGPDWQFEKSIVPAWIRPLRFAAKAAHALKGRAAWHRFEKSWFAWHTDVVSNYAISPYKAVSRDRRGHRNAISWHVDRYLAQKGYTIGLDGTVTQQ